MVCASVTRLRGRDGLCQLGGHSLRPSATILADSINPVGVRLTTAELVLHRFVLAELNTHRDKSRNSASSRAEPVKKTLARFTNEWAKPLSMPVEQPGMSGGDELEGADLEDAENLLREIHDFTADKIRTYLESHAPEHRLHKSVLNRPMEWGQWHTVILSGTEWENFFNLRLAPNAQPEFRAACVELSKAMADSTPTKLKRGEWHLPLTGFEKDEELSLTDLIKVSVARCARVSYLTHYGLRDVEADLQLFENLKENGHLSPFEHPAQAQGGTTGSGNFRGFKQARRFIELGEPFDKPFPKRKRTAYPGNFTLSV